jgi:hypothetical protein
MAPSRGVVEMTVGTVVIPPSDPPPPPPPVALPPVALPVVALPVVALPVVALPPAALPVVVPAPPEPPGPLEGPQAAASDSRSTALRFVTRGKRKNRIMGAFFVSIEGG